MKKVIVTGGASGIGLATALMFTNNNYKVYAIDIKATESADTRITHIILDIDDLDALKDTFKFIGNFDILINNAAIQSVKLFSETNTDEIKDVLNTNLISTVMLTRLALDYLKADSHIINIGSVHSNKPRQNKLTYDISKAALDMFTKSLALELAPLIRVNQINIGATYTPMNELFKTDQKLVEETIGKIPMNHIFQPNEIAEVIYALSQDTFKYMTGSIIIYDGGRSLF